MKPAFRLAHVILPLLIAHAAYSAGAPADGLYQSAQGAPAPQVQTQDGKTLFLGERRDVDITAQDNLLASNNNANTLFRLNLGISGGTPTFQDEYILVVAGTAYGLKGWSTAVGRGTSQLTFQISGEENANQVAKYLGLPVSLFRHPGYRLSTSFTPTRPSFARGENVTATLKIVNVGPEAVAFSVNPCDVYDGPSTTRGPWYKFAAYMDGHSIPDIGDTSSKNFYCGGSTFGPTATTLNPGAAYERTIDLNKWFDFNQPGAYEIHGSVALNFVEALPFVRLRDFKFLWADYVSADFTVRID